MNSSVQARPRGFGVAGSLIGLLALIAVVVPQWVLPAIPSAVHTEQVAVEKPRNFKERILERLKLATPKKQETRREPDNWRQPFMAAGVALALSAIALAVFSVIRREERLYASMAAALGIAALTFQLAILFAGIAIAMLVIYALQGQADAGFPLVVTVGGAILVLSVMAIPILGLGSPMLIGLVIGAAILFICISWLLS